MLSQFTRCFAVVAAFVCMGNAFGQAIEHPENPTYRFSAADEQLLGEIQFGAFQYFWKEVGDPVPIVRDRKLGPVCSIAAVGFQLTSLPIGVERGWITRAQGEERARQILQGLIRRDDNKHLGIYLHFPDLNTGGMSHEGYELLSSTVDHALLLAGVIVAGEYFDGEVGKLASKMVHDSNWKAYAVAKNGLLSMGWKPTNPDKDMNGAGEFLDAHWSYAADEDRLIYFLAIGTPNKAHQVEPRKYYELLRPVKRFGDGEPFVVSWPGALFTYFFSHCWIDFRSAGPDNPGKVGLDQPAIDWVENSRRAVLSQRRRCLDAADKFKTFGDERWGLSACDGKTGYIVPGIRPNGADQDRWEEGTVAPYAALSAIMFAPKESLAAARAFRALKDDDGKPLVWRDPAQGGYGFADAFNLDQGFVSEDYIGIDQGPMLVAIENARTGLIWRLFAESETSKLARERLGLKPAQSE